MVNQAFDQDYRTWLAENSADPKGFWVIWKLSCGSKWINRDYWGWKLTASPREDPGELFDLETLLTSLSSILQGVWCAFSYHPQQYEDIKTRFVKSGKVVWFLLGSCSQSCMLREMWGWLLTPTDPHWNLGQAINLHQGIAGGGLILKNANTDIHYCQSEHGSPGSLHPTPYDVKYSSFLTQIMPQDKPQTENCSHLQGV